MGDSSDSVVYPPSLRAGLLSWMPVSQILSRVWYGAMRIALLSKSSPTQRGGQQLPSPPRNTTQSLTRGHSTPAQSVSSGQGQTPPIGFPIAVYSHRGGALETRAEGHYVENTLPAFINSASLKVDVLELDVQLTADCHVIVLHDISMVRLWGPRFKGKTVADFNYADLPPFDPNLAASKGLGGASPTQVISKERLEQSNSFARSSVKSASDSQTQSAASAAHAVAPSGVIESSSIAVEQAKEDLQSLHLPQPLNGGEPMLHVGQSQAPGFAGMSLPLGMTADDYRPPLLSEVFECCPGIPVQIDVKVATPGLVEAVHEEICKYGKQDEILWGSFRSDVNAELFDTNPDIPLFCSIWRLLFLLASFKAGYRNVAIYESAIILPWKPPFPFSLAMEFLDPAFHAWLHSKGVASILYGDANDKVAFDAIRLAGGNAVCTDAPSRLQEYLRTHTLAPLPT